MDKKNRWIKISLLVIGILMYIVFVIVLCYNSGFHADPANHLLQADDILSGNIFLSDWNLTGITFYTTDLIYYEIGRLFFGVSETAIAVAIGLMISSVSISSLMVALVGKKNFILIRVLGFVLLAMIPCYAVIVHTRVHGGAVFCCLISFALVYFITQNENIDRRTVYILLFITLFMGSFGDMLTIIEGVLPIVCLCGYRLLKSNEQDKTDSYKLIIILSAASAFLSVISDKLFFAFGSAEKNSYIGEKMLTPSDQWFERLSSLSIDIMKLLMADFSGSNIADIWNLMSVVYFIVFIISIGFIIRIIYELLVHDGEKIDDLTVVLCFGIIFSSAAYIFTDMSQIRYITLISVALMAILIRNIEWLYNGVKNTKLLTVIILGIYVIGSIAKIHNISKIEYSYENKRAHELIDFLEEKNLSSGYSSFWNSSNITVLSGNKIKIRHINFNGESYDIYNWFNKNSWYDDYANFLLVNIEDPISMGNEMDEISFTSAFGLPSERYEISGFLVLVYDYDISEKLGSPINVLSDGIIDITEISYNDNVKIENSDAIITTGGLIFGPYESIESGQYQIKFIGENFNAAEFDVWSNSSDNMTQTITERTSDYVIITFELYEQIPDIEFRVFNNSEEEVILNKILIE